MTPDKLEQGSERKARFKVGQLVAHRIIPAEGVSRFFKVARVSRISHYGHFYYEDENQKRNGLWGTPEKKLRPITKKEYRG